MVINNVRQHTSFYKHGQRGSKAPVILTGSGIQKCMYYGLNKIFLVQQESGAHLCVCVCVFVCVCVCVCVHVKWCEINWALTFREVETPEWHFRRPASEFSLLSTHPDIKIYRNVTLPFVLYGCDTWSITLTEKRRLRVLENRVLRRIIRPKKDEVSGEWRRLHNEELHDLYSPRNVIRVIKPRRMRWAGQEVGTGDKKVHTRFWWEDLSERGHLEDMGVDGKLILKWIFKSGTGQWLDWSGSEQEEMEDSC